MARKGREQKEDDPSLAEPRKARSDRTTSQDPRLSWRTTAAMLGLPAFAAAAVFANILWNEFVYDDKWTLDRLPLFSDAPSWMLLQSGRGLTYLVHLMDHSLWGSWEPGFHLTNIVLHALACSLAACAAFVLIRSARVALLCGLLFAVHPVHVEVVAVFSYRKDILAMIFVFLALICWLSTRRQVLCYLASFVCLALALLSKEVAAVGLIPMLFMADLLPGHQHPAHWKRRLRRAIWRILPAIVVGIIATTAFAGDILDYFTPQSIQEVSGGQLRNYREVLATAAGSVPDLVRLMFLPIKLSIDYAAPTITSLRDPSAMLGVIILLSWMVVGALLLRRAPMAAFLVAWPLILYFPCSNIVPLTKFFVAERYLYIPSFGICLLMAFGLDRAMRATEKHSRSWPRSGVVFFATLLLLAGGARSFLRNRDWRDDHSIWSSCLHAGLDSPRIRNNLGLALARQDRYEEALQHFERAWRFNPYQSGIRRNMAKALIELGRLDEADEHCREILRMHPNDADVRSLVDEISTRQADSEEATSRLAPD